MDGGAGGELLFYVLKYGLLLITIVGISRLLLLRNDRKRHISTKIVTSISVILTLYLFVGTYFEHKARIKQLSGTYKVITFRCEKCVECNAILKSDGTYELKQNQNIIDNGKWDFKENEMGLEDFDLIFDGYYTYGRKEISKKIISYIKNVDCRN